MEERVPHHTRRQVSEFLGYALQLPLSALTFLFVKRSKIKNYPEPLDSVGGGLGIE